MLGEGSGKIGIIVESAQKANVNGRLSLTKELLCLGKPFFNDVLLNRHAGIGFENPGQIHRVQVHLSGDVFQEQVFRQMIIDVAEGFRDRVRR